MSIQFQRRRIAHVWVSVLLSGFLGGCGARPSANTSSFIVEGPAGCVVELLDDRTSDVRQTWTLPMHELATAPAGTYQLRYGQAGTPTESLSITLVAGVPEKFQIEQPDRLLWRHVGKGLQRQWLATPTGSNFVALDETSVTCLRGQDGSELWTCKIYEEFGEGFPNAPKSLLGAIASPWHFYEIAVARDVNNDGHDDLIFTMWQPSHFIALDGKTGKSLWHHDRRAAMVHDPVTVPDLNDDGIEDLAAIYCDYSTHDEQVHSCWIEAICASTGTKLLRVDLPEIAKASVAMQLPGRSLYDGSPSPRNLYEQTRPHDSRPVIARPDVEYEQTRPGLPGKLHVVDGRELVVACDWTIVRVDLTQPKDVEQRETLDAHQLRGRHWMPMCVKNVAGDSTPEIICVVTADPIDADRSGGLPLMRTKLPEIVAWSLEKEAVLWSRELQVWLPENRLLKKVVARWPIVEDLDGDGLAEVVVPTRSPGSYTTDAPWGELSVLDGATGEPRWSRQIFTQNQQLDTFEVGPDVDGDGVREVFIATLFGDPLDLYVDSLSGADGTTIWRNSHRLQRHALEDNTYDIRPLQWWHCGIDGWPQLIVPLSGGLTSKTLLFSAGTGNVTHVGRDVFKVETVDLDGDKYDELITHSPTFDDDLKDEISCWQGGVVEVTSWFESSESDWSSWRRIDDLNEDGIADAIRFHIDGRVQAISLVTGKTLFERRVLEETQFAQHHIAAVGDVNGDGQIDIIIGEETGYLTALSGENGRLLWQSNVEVRFADGSFTGQLLDVHIFANGAGRPADVIAAAGADARVTSYRNGRQQWEYSSAAEGVATLLNMDKKRQATTNVVVHLAASNAMVCLDRQAGDVRWRCELESTQDFDPVWPFGATDSFTLDWDGDGDLDVLWMTGTYNRRSIDNDIRFEAWIADYETGELIDAIAEKNVYGLPQPVCLASGDVALAWERVDSETESTIVSNREISLPRMATNDRVRGRWYVLDVDDDGTDEILVHDKKTLSLHKVGHGNDAVWQREIPVAFTALSVRSATDDITAEIQLLRLVQRDGNDIRVDRIGLDATTGKTRWKIPTARKDTMRRWIGPLPNSKQVAGGLPRCLLVTANVTRLHQAVPTDQSRLKLVRAAPTTSTTFRDRRGARPLPWRELKYRIGPGTTWPTSWITCLMAIALIAAPVTYLGWIVTRRRWSLKLLLLAPVVIGGVVAALTTDLELIDEPTLALRFIFALCGLPLITTVVVVITLTYQRRWRAIIVLVAACLACSLLGAAAWIWFDQHRVPIVAAEYYSWARWYEALAIGPFIVGAVLAVTLPWFLLVSRILGMSRRRGSS